MARSGSKNYSITRGDIIESALLKIGEYDQGDVVPGDEAGTAARTLNLMVKNWTARGADLFLRQTQTLFLQKDAQSYTLGQSGSAEITESYVETTILTAATSGDTTIPVTSTAGMTDADRIGIKMDDNSIHWTTVTSILSTTSVLIGTAIDDDAAVGNKVYAYTTKADNPQKLVYAYRRDTSDQDTTVEIIGESQYRGLSQKGSSGPVNQVWYHPTLDNGTLYTWPVDPGKTTDKLILIANILSDDLDITGNNPEYPIEWGECLVYGLAARLAPEYGIDIRNRQMLNFESEKSLMEMLDYDVENASVIFALGG